jgi:hypothetical protein
MTVESLMNTLTQYVSWLYSGRQWAKWELQIIAATVLVLLLFILILRRKARNKKAMRKQTEQRPSTIGINLEAGKEVPQEFKSDPDSRHVISISNPMSNGNHKGWKETTKKWKNFQKLLEQLQQETSRYKQAQEQLEQQFARLKDANEQLRQAITGSNMLIQESETSRLRPIDSFDKEQGRILNTSEAAAKGI